VIVEANWLLQRFAGAPIASELGQQVSVFVRPD